jgi:hypothetical protein
MEGLTGHVRSHLSLLLFNLDLVETAWYSESSFHRTYHTTGDPCEAHNNYSYNPTVKILATFEFLGGA